MATKPTAAKKSAPAKSAKPAAKSKAPATKTAQKRPATKAAPVKAAPLKAAPPAKAPKAAVEKPKRPKLVRDSFTIPKAEYAALDELKLRAAKLGHPVKKSELLRAGIKALLAQADAALLATLGTVPSIKTGRPKKD